MKPIPEIPNYEIARDGTIRHLPSGRIRKKHIPSDPQRYPMTGFRIKGKLINKFIHRLVAEVYCEKPEGVKVEVHHIDGDRQNYHADNLKWVTHKENIEHARISGIIYSGKEYVSTVIAKHFLEIDRASLYVLINHHKILDSIKINHIRYISMDSLIALRNKGNYTGSNKAKPRRRNFSRLKKEDVKEIRVLTSQGKSDRELAEQYGVTPTTINYIRTGRTWGHIK